jgi:hypothetical protein
MVRTTRPRDPRLPVVHPHISIGPPVFINDLKTCLVTTVIDGRTMEKKENEKVQHSPTTVRDAFKIQNDQAAIGSLNLWLQILATASWRPWVHR